MAFETGTIRDMLDIVFQNRNRAYGAYQIRREYPEYMRKALLSGVALILLAFAGPYIFAKVAGAFERAKPVEVVAEMGPPPDIDPNTPPPPPPPPVVTPPPPVRTTVAFVPPVVKKDEEVVEEKQQDIEELKENKADISTKTVEGTPDAAPDVVEPTELKVVEEKKPEPVEDETIHDYVEKPPSFPGGEAELLKFLAENIKYPALAKESNISGRCILSFIVNKKGDIEDVKVLKDIGGGCGKEAMRVVNSMPRWNVGEQNGHSVKVRYTLPVQFRLE
jgi:periplasmic protein TonB